MSIRFASDIAEPIAAVAAAESAGVFSDAVRLLLIEALSARERRHMVPVSDAGQVELERIAREGGLAFPVVVRQALKYACIHVSEWTGPPTRF